MNVKPRDFCLLTTKPILALFVLWLCVAAYFSFRWALADVMAVQVRYQIGRAQIVGQSLTATQWRICRTQMENALALHSDYSTHMDLAKLFYQVQSNQPETLQNELAWRHNRETSLAFNRRALLTRSSWPYFWAELVVVKAGMNQFDTELTGAMARAVELGPWEELVQYDVATMGLDHWDRLDAEARPWAIRAVNRTLLIQKDPIPYEQELSAHANIGAMCSALGAADQESLLLVKGFCERLKRRA